MVFLINSKVLLETTGKVVKAATRWQANSWKLLDKYDDVNFVAILGT